MNELIGVIIFLFLAPALGFGAGYALSYHCAARELALLRGLVPSPGLLRRAAEYAARVAFVDSSDVASVDSDTLLALTTRIEAAGTGAVTVPPAWEQTPTWRET